MVVKGLKIKKDRKNWKSRKNRDHPDHSNVEIHKNTKKRPGNLSRLAHSDFCERPPVKTSVNNSQEQVTRPCDIQQNKKRTCQIVDFATPVEHGMKLKESEKRAKYLDLDREKKNCGT